MQLSAQYAKIGLPFGLAAYDKEDVFACRFVFAHTPCGFCIVFSMSHTVGDGNTFYNILNQLSATEEVRPLQAKRNLDFKNNVRTILGRNSDQELGLRFKLSTLTSFVGTAAKRMFVKNKTRVFRGLLDREQITKLKADAQSRGTVPFVSTNDIITSAFSNASGLHTCLMAYNFRKRMSGLAESHAGNYVKCMVFDNINAGTPDGVRRALRNPQLPCRSGRTKIFSRAGLITNWSAFSKPIRIPRCVEQLHQPLMDLSSSGLKYMPFDAMCVFRAGDQGLGAYWITTKRGSQKDVIGDIPFVPSTLKCDSI